MFDVYMSMGKLKKSSLIFEMRQSRIRHLRLQNLFEVFFPFQFFTLALLLSVALRWVFYLKNIFPFLLKTPWQFFKFGGIISKITLWLNFITFKLCFSTKVVAWAGRRSLFKICIFIYFTFYCCFCYRYLGSKNEWLFFLLRLESSS